MEDSFAKGLRLMEALAASDHPMGLTELARECDLLKSHVHKFLRTLIDRGYVEQKVERGPYQLTLKIWQLGIQFVSRLDLPSAAREPVQRLSSATRETVQLAVIDDDEVVYIYNVDGTHDVRAHTEVGRRRPLHCVAAGKAMLAFMPDAATEAACKNLKKFTKDTITSPKKFRSELQTIRDTGFAVNRGEWTPMVRGLSAPVWDAHGNVVAAVNLSIPTERLQEADIVRLAPKVIQTAHSISRALGSQNPSRRTAPSDPVRK